MVCRLKWQCLWATAVRNRDAIALRAIQGSPFINAIAYRVMRDDRFCTRTCSMRQPFPFGDLIASTARLSVALVSYARMLLWCATCSYWVPMRVIALYQVLLYCVTHLGLDCRYSDQTSCFCLSSHLERKLWAHCSRSSIMPCHGRITPLAVLQFGY